MTGIDLIILIFIALVTYIGFKRGLILEVFDLAILILDTALTLHIYKYFADFILSIFPQAQKAAYLVSFIVIFILLGIVLVLIALAIDKVIKLTVILKPFNSLGGALFAFAKAFLIIWIIILAIFLSPLKKELKHKVYHSSASKIVWSTTPYILDLVDLFAPTKFSEGLRKSIDKLKF